MPATAGDLRRLQRDLDSAARTLRGAGSILIISHIDADGISAGAIADITAERLGKEHTVRFEKKISEETVEAINSSEEDIVWICDLGSGYLSEFEREGIIVTDHHVPDPRWRRKQTVLDSFSGIAHLNPHSYGMDGSYEVCGAGMTYLLSKAVDPSNTDLAYLAVVGAVGDFQDSNHSGLTGMNRTIMADAEANGTACLAIGERDVVVINPDKAYEDTFVKGLNVTNLDLSVPLSRLEGQRILQFSPFITAAHEATLMAGLEHCTSARWHQAFCDITSLDADKGKGLAAMAARLGLDISETMAFGDGANDIPIIRTAGVGVAMGNAGPDVKAAADYTTTPVDDDGIRNALVRYGVI